MSAEFAGALDQRVTVRRRATDRDDLGGAVGEWGDGVEVWAGVTPLAGLAGLARWRVVVRVGVEVAPGDRLGWRSCDFAVRSVEANPATPDRLTLIVEEER